MPRLVSPRSLVAVLAVVVALAAGACASDGDVSKEQFQADLQTRTDIADGPAACITEAIFHDYDQHEINRIYRAATEDELGNERRDELVAINERCFSSDSSDSSDSSESSTTTSTTSTSTSTTEG